jgi:preprotein translocase subunit SecG
MQAVLIIIHLLVAIALICVVLLQRSEGGALGMGGGGAGIGGLFSPRGAASTLTRTTAILGLVFFITSMSLTLLSLGARQPTSILNQVPPGTAAPANPNAPPALPSRAPPTLPSANPAVPAAPALPAVPPTR